MTNAEILQLAAKRDFIVAIHTWRAESLRKQTRRMFKEGALVMVMRTKSHFHYRAAK